MVEIRADVLVVGGGVLGLAHAWAALRAGYKVMLVERSLAPRGASVRNFGMIWPIGQAQGPELDLALRSRVLWGELASVAGFRCEATGSLHLAYADDEWAVLREFVQRSPLPDLALLDPDETLARQRAIVRRDLRGALWSPNEANVDPPVAMAAIQRWLQVQGVAMRFGQPVLRIEGQTAQLADGSKLGADRIVVCSGDEFRLLYPEVFAASGLWRCKLQMLALGPQPPQFRLGPMLAGGLTLLHYGSFADCPTLPRLRRRLHAAWPECIARGIHVMVAQADDGRLIVGDSHAYGDDLPVGQDAATEQWILDYLSEFLQPPTRRIERRWTGVYALAKAGVGAFRAVPDAGVEIVTGVGGAGMTKAMALGEASVSAWRASSAQELMGQRPRGH